MKDQGNSRVSVDGNEVVYLVYTDVIGSSEKDKDPNQILEWRKKTFTTQLSSLLNPENALVLKSIGDALFLIYGLKKDNGEKVFIEKLLSNVWESFQAHNNDNQGKDEISIRVAVHRITKHKRGHEIAQHLKSELKNNDINRKGSNFLESLERDIFGLEVNRAARILSLVKGSAILVTESVAKQLDLNHKEKAIKGQDIPVRNHNGKMLVLHSPVPVLYMKGILGDKKHKRILLNIPSYTVWELEKEEKEPTLAKEFKSIQSLRFGLVCHGASGNLNDLRQKIDVEVLTKLGIMPSNGFPDFVRKFYIDNIWKVENFYMLRNPSFMRAEEGAMEKKSFAAFLNRLVENKEEKKGDTFLNGQGYKISLVKSGEVNIIRSKIAEPKSTFLSFLALTSFPDDAHMALTRNLLSYRKSSPRSKISSVEPISLRVHENIKLSNNFLTKIKSDPSANTLSLEGKNFLVLFQAYFDYLNEATSTNIFKGISKKRDLGYDFCGLLAGLLDGFVVYADSSSLEQFLKKLIGAYYTPGNAHFYKKTYPVAIFELVPVADYLPLKRNFKFYKTVK